MISQKLTDGKVGEYWKGPVVVTAHLRYGESERERRFGIPNFREVTGIKLMDLRHAVDCFVKFPECEPQKIPGSIPWLAIAVRSFLKSSRFEAI